MYSKDNRQWRREFDLRRWNHFAALVLSLWIFQMRGATLMEEGFNYPAASALAADSPWTGTANGSLGIAAGSLSVTNLRSIFPGGNQLQLTGDATANAHRNFSSVAISNDVYCSFLINCAAAPTTNQQFLVSLLRSGATGASPPDDPLDVYARSNGAGFSFAITSVGSDRASSSRILPLNTTHLVVIKYTFGILGLGSLYIDPAPGGTEPASPDISTSSDDDVGASNLQVLLFRSTAGLGTWSFDSVRVGTNWSDVVPAGIPLAISGPQDQAICVGSPAAFNVAVEGTPPFIFQWRTNGVAVPGATNNFLSLAAPGVFDASNTFDVVVQDSFTIATSQVARLAISSVAAGIKTQPSSAIVAPSSSNAVFEVSAVGDAPLSYQWRTNGVVILGATNDSYTVTNPASVDPSIQYDVVVSNPCGVVTSSPPALLIFPSVFYTAYDAGPGFFSGENLVLTNVGGLTLQAWSSESLSIPITNWNLEGLMQEQPLNDGSGKSFYSINVTPAISPTYYIFGSKNSPPYLAPIPILTITLDPDGFYILANSQMGISPNGVLGFPAIQLSVSPHPGGGLDLSGNGIPGNIYVLQMCTNLQQANSWIPVQTNTADSSGVVNFLETDAPGPVRFYRLLGQ